MKAAQDTLARDSEAMADLKKSLESEREKAKISIQDSKLELETLRSKHEDLVRLLAQRDVQEKVPPLLFLFQYH